MNETVQTTIVLKNGNSFTIPFVKESLDDLLYQMHHSINEDWDLGGIEVKTLDVESVNVLSIGGFIEDEVLMEKEFNILQNQLSTGGIHAFVGFNEVMDEFDHIDYEEFELILKFLLTKVDKRRAINNE